MVINRSGPPATHDRVTWRVPLSAPPSIDWQRSFREAEGSTPPAMPKAVQFEHAALTFRSSDDDVPMWIEHIDRWIASVNKVQGDLDDERRRGATRVEQESETRRQRVSEANERFKNL